jgi:opacity protein-like surface antigen
MKKFVFGSVLAVSLGSFAAFADNLTGYVSESHCADKHSTVSAENTKCIQTCLKGGSDPVLVSNGKVYKFDAGSRDKAVAHAGEDVKIDGTVSGDTVTVSSIEKAGAKEQ